MIGRLNQQVVFLFKMIVERGMLETIGLIRDRFFLKQYCPMSHIDNEVLFVSQVPKKSESRNSNVNLRGAFSDSSNLDASYPKVFEYNGKIVRYSYNKAEGKPKGLVVLFHGWGGEFSSGLKPKGWDGFDVLAPWDSFGYNRRGSWFWGEKGDNFVEKMITALIAEKRRERQELPWFCFGYSMGGFGALYHAIHHQADGVYAMMPQVDLKLKAEEYKESGKMNPYGHLFDDSGTEIPDLLQVAAEQKSLPPLFLIQNQEDPVNPFADHGYRLLEQYNNKNGWYSLRVYPACGHTHDGFPEEARQFFESIIEKRFPRSSVTGQKE